jgi:hypothetical protein
MLRNLKNLLIKRVVIKLQLLPTEHISICNQGVDFFYLLWFSFINMFVFIPQLNIAFQSKQIDK